MNTRIDDLTLEDLSSDGSGSEADLVAFKAACRNYYREHPLVTERQAIEVIFGEGHFWERVHKYAPVEAKAADQAEDEK